MDSAVGKVGVYRTVLLLGKRSCGSGHVVVGVVKSVVWMMEN